MDLVEGVAERETLDRVGDVAVEHADAADGGVVRHAHLHSVTVTTTTTPCCCSLLTPHRWLLATIAISPAHRVPWLLAESLTHTNKVEQTTHDTAFHWDNDIIGVNGNVS